MFNGRPWSRRDDRPDLFGQRGVLFEQAMDCIADPQQLLGISVGLLELAIGLLRRHLLPNHDDRQQHELQESLGDPGNERRGAPVDRLRQADQREAGEGVGAPHRADDVGDGDREPVVEPALAFFDRFQEPLAEFQIGVGLRCHAIPRPDDRGLAPPRRVST